MTNTKPTTPWSKGDDAVHEEALRFYHESRGLVLHLARHGLDRGWDPVDTYNYLMQAAAMMRISIEASGFARSRQGHSARDHHVLLAGQAYDFAEGIAELSEDSDSTGRD